MKTRGRSLGQRALEDIADPVLGLDSDANAAARRGFLLREGARALSLGGAKRGGIEGEAEKLEEGCFSAALAAEMMQRRVGGEVEVDAVEVAAADLEEEEAGVAGGKREIREERVGGGHFEMAVSGLGVRWWMGRRAGSRGDRSSGGAPLWIPSVTGRRELRKIDGRRSEPSPAAGDQSGVVAGRRCLRHALPFRLSVSEQQARRSRRGRVDAPRKPSAPSGRPSI